MATLRFRQRSWRFYRNWLFQFMVWVVWFVIALRAVRDPGAWWIYLLVVLPLIPLSAGVFYAYRTTHPGGRFAMRRVTPADAGMDFEAVEFPSRDGLTLFGWYIPSQNGAYILLVHDHGKKGISMIYHASALVAKGYGVLMFDLRAHGSSDGDTCTAGWRETEDLLGAVDYLASRPEVDGQRIGVLGVGMGAQVALRAAARESALRAVVADSPTPAVLEDHAVSLWGYGLYYRLLALMNGSQPPHGVLAQIGEISPTPLLLIHTGEKADRATVRRFYEAAGEPKDLWNVSATRRAEAYFHDPKAYQKRVVEFFDRAFHIIGASSNSS